LIFHLPFLRPRRLLAVLALLAVASIFRAQPSTPASAELSGRIVLPAAADKSHSPATVVWLSPLNKSAASSLPPGRFRLVQKNRMFTPHLLVIPVGSIVIFPNEDPFFHNVFSLFNGKRFDLGLYEAGSSREVLFSREGVSYIFCNIHPTMSAVVIALSSPLFNVADAAHKFTIHSIPPGEYDLHVWIEGAQQPALEKLTRHIVLTSGQTAMMSIDASDIDHPTHDHLNKFGKPYAQDARPPY
jgi:plastocyanin